MGRDTEMLLDTDRDKNIDLIGQKMSIFCRTHITVGHRIQGGSPGPLRRLSKVQLNVSANDFAHFILFHFFDRF